MSLSRGRTVVMRSRSTFKRGEGFKPSGRRPSSSAANKTADSKSCFRRGSHVGGSGSRRPLRSRRGGGCMRGGPLSATGCSVRSAPKEDCWRLEREDVCGLRESGETGGAPRAGRPTSSADGTAREGEGRHRGKEQGWLQAQAEERAVPGIESRQRTLGNKETARNQRGHGLGRVD
jgi:hypothetical protein